MARTDVYGEVKAYFSSGTINRSNQTATITASVANLNSAQIPIQITGTTITLSTGSTNLEIDPLDTSKAQTTLTITIKDAGDIMRQSL